MLIVENWRPVPGHENHYSVSDLGRVRSEDRVLTRSDGVSRFWPGKILAANPNAYGYPEVQLGRNCNERVHILVLNAFVGPRPSTEHQACHNDGSRSNNRLENLRWGTTSENQQDRVEHGTSFRGAGSPNAKLTDAQVRLMRRLRGEFKQSELAGMFECSQSLVSSVQRDVSWVGV